MHTPVEALLNGLRAWDGEAMGQAAIAAIESAGEAAISAATRKEITWQFRELLEQMEGHPMIGQHFTVPELGCDFVLEGSVEWTDQPGKARHRKVLLHFGPAVGKDTGLSARWRAMGFPGRDIVLERDEVRTPLPLQDEPGYAPRASRPSIHRPSRPTAAAPGETYRYALAAEAEGPKPLLDRYLAGQCEDVWNELARIGTGVRDLKILPDAVAVARETMRRCRRNLEVVVGRLKKLGYRFEERPLRPPARRVLRQIEEIEEKVGPIPLSVSAWYELVGSVSLVGWLPGWENLPTFPDPLVVGPSRFLLTYDEENWTRGQYRLEFSPDDCAKADTSGGSPYTILLPDASADPKVEHEWHHTSFVNCLRIAFRWGGFPGLERASPEWRPQHFVEALVEGLSPI